MSTVKTLDFQGNKYTINQCGKENYETLFEWGERSRTGDYTVYFDKVVFKTEKGVIAAYSNNLENYWEI